MGFVLKAPRTREAMLSPPPHHPPPPEIVHRRGSTFLQSLCVLRTSGAVM